MSGIGVKVWGIWLGKQGAAYHGPRRKWRFPDGVGAMGMEYILLEGDVGEGVVECLRGGLELG